MSTQTRLVEVRQKVLKQNDVVARAIPEERLNLDRLPAKVAMVIAMPMKIRGGSGGPLRIIAFVDHARD